MRISLNSPFAEPRVDITIPLDHLPPGQKALVDTVVGQREFVQRMSEIGLRSGAIVEMVKTGSPCILRLNGNKLCLRGEELLQVLVRPEVTT